MLIWALALQPMTSQPPNAMYFSVIGCSGIVTALPPAVAGVLNGE
jgi:hypothetical protein